MTATTPTLRPATDGETGGYLSGHRAIPGAVETEHGIMVPVRGREVLVIERLFFEDSVHDGDADYHETRMDVFECDDTGDAVRVIEREGLTFGSTGTDWAANPDGSTIVDYATGERVETTAHLYGFTATETAAIIERVG